MVLVRLRFLFLRVGGVVILFFFLLFCWICAILFTGNSGLIQPAICLFPFYRNNLLFLTVILLVVFEMFTFLTQGVCAAALVG